MKKALSVFITLVMVLAMTQVGVFKVSAAQSGNYTYSVSGSQATITGYTGAGGAVSLPATLGGYPVTEIDGYAFYFCTKLTSVAIPDSVTVIDPEAFVDCTGLTAITVGSGNSQYSSSDGVLFDKSGSNLIIYPCGKPGSYSIPGGTTGIGDYAFEDCAGLTGVTIPDDVTSAGQYAFVGCTNLTSVTFGSGMTVIDDGMFQGCTALTNITLPANMATIGMSVFCGCSKLSSITLPGSVTSIGDGAFAECEALSSITIPDSVTSIGVGAFSDCTELTGITLPDNVTAISEGVFEGCSKLAGVTILGSVTSIGQEAFAECAALSGITIPDSVTSIGEEAFSHCAELTGITLPTGVTAIGEGTFEGCSNLAVVTILGSVTSIGDGAFTECAALSSFTIPDSVTSIGSGAFLGCIDLTGITIPQKVATIGEEVFAVCPQLLQIEVNVNNTHYSSADGVLFNKGKTALLAYPGAKSGSYSIPSGVTSLSEYAFEDCWQLTGITIPDSVASIGEMAFSGCEKLLQLTVSSGNQHYTSLSGVLYNKGKTSLIQYPGAKTGSYSIAGSVTSIADGAFYGSSGLTGVTIPSAVSSIGTEAFSNCTSLTGITIPNSVTSIGTFAFDWCTALTQITVGSGNPSYSSSGGALYNKAKTELIVYPAGKAGSYIIPTGVTGIDNEAFEFCAGLTGVTIPNSMTSIGSGTFLDCTGLTSVTIPGSVTGLGDYAFCGCANLASVYFLGNAPYIESDVFGGCSSELTIYSVSGNTGFPLDGYTNATFTPAAVTAPTGLTAVSGGYNSVKLSWSASSASGLASGYQIWRSTSKAGPYSLVGTTTATGYTNTGLTAGTTYYYEVRAVRVDGNINSYSSYTAVASARPIPPTPTGQKAASASYSSVKLTWNAVSGASGYGIYRSTSATGSYTLIANTTSTSDTNTGLTAGKAYYYKISAYRAVGSAKVYGGQTAAVGVKPVPATVAAAATRYSSTGIRVSWGAIGGASGYEVYRSTSASGTYSLIKTTTSTSLVNTGLTKGKAYYYKVRAYRMVGSTKVYGAFSAVKSVKL